MISINDRLCAIIQKHGTCNKLDSQANGISLSPEIKASNSCQFIPQTEDYSFYYLDDDNILTFAARQNDSLLLRVILEISDLQKTGPTYLNHNQQLLLEKGDNNGETPLFHAIRMNIHNNIQILLQCGANVHHQNRKLQLAIDVAYEMKAWDSMLSLLVHGSPWPLNFNLDNIPEAECTLINFIERNNEISNLITHGKNEEIIKSVYNGIITKDFINIKNQSAVSIAYSHQKFETFVFLKINGFKQNWYELPIDTNQLSILEKSLLKNVMASSIKSSTTIWRN